MQPNPTDALDLHTRLLTLDSHIDIPWPDGPDPFTQTNRRVDIGKMTAGGLRAGCFVAYVPQGPCTPDGWHSARSRALAMLGVIQAMGAERNGLRARLTQTVAAIRQAAADGAIAIIPAVENGHAIGEDPCNPGSVRRPRRPLSHPDA